MLPGGESWEAITIAGRVALGGFWIQRPTSPTKRRGGDLRREQFRGVCRRGGVPPSVRVPPEMMYPVMLKFRLWALGLVAVSMTVPAASSKTASSVMVPHAEP